jgi:hypothetical protein
LVPMLNVASSSTIGLLLMCYLSYSMPIATRNRKLGVVPLIV